MLFPGGELPLESMEKIFRNVSQEEVHYNQCYVLSPKKSVAYLAMLTRNKDEICAGICASCARMDCPNRQLGAGKGAAVNMEKITTGNRCGRICQAYLCLMVISVYFTGIQPKRKA